VQAQLQAQVQAQEHEHKHKHPAGAHKASPLTHALSGGGYSWLRIHISGRPPMFLDSLRY
jgi:hypothetical protein